MYKLNGSFDVTYVFEYVELILFPVLCFYDSVFHVFCSHRV